jgi:TrmH RNA methyltransferase
MNSRHPSDPHDHDDHIDEAEDNKGNSIDYKLPKPSIFKGEGAPQLPTRAERFGRGPRGPRGPGGMARPEPYGNGHPFAGNGGGAERGNGGGERGPRHSRGGRGRNQGGGQGGIEPGNRGPRPQGGGFSGGQGGEPGNRAPRPQGGQGGGEGNGNNRGPRQPGELQARGPRPDQQQRGPRPQGERHGRGGRDQQRGPRPEAPVGEGIRPSAAQRPDETRIYGVNACLAAYEKRPESIIRAYIANHILHRFGYTMKYLAEQRRAYHIVDDAELERITESQHHGGVCFLVRKRVPITLPEFIQLMEGRPQVRAVLLDGVGNPHNLGAIVRTCAHFGVDGVLSADPDATQSGAAARVAEGATESITLVRTEGLRPTVEALKAAGFTVVVTSSHAEADLYATELSPRCVIVVGSEGEGVAPEALELADVKVKIPGTGAIESLNVSVATGVILAEFARRARG